MFEDIPVDVSPMHEGERIRSANMFVELAGPKSIGAELVQVKDEVEDGKVEVRGPEIDEMEQGQVYPFAINVEVAGSELEEELESVIERRLHELCNYVKGFMHLNQRDQIWCRVSTEAKDAGFRLEHLGKALSVLFREEFPIIESIAVTLMTDEAAVQEFLETAREKYETRDSRARELSDEDVDVFYGCLMCQSFAPTHVCIVTPDRTALCGAINWFDCRAAYKMDPDGPIFEIEKGEVLDPERGEYANVNAAVEENSQGTTDRVYLHSVFGYPHTSCGCFEAVAFYIPELDGIGIVNRDFRGETPLGIPFSAMAGQCSGGKQVEGFSGLSLEYMRSPKFLQADGGYHRVIWMPRELKESVLEFIPEDVRDKIATEEDATSIKDLRRFLRDNEHPVLERAAVEETEPEEEEVEEAYPEETPIPEGVPVMAAPEMTLPAAGGFRIVLKNAKIYAEKVIIKRK
ncbi:acetyl-CoA decarbonylase/synthase complex beta subunit [Methanothermobacter sp. CaT2]|jgi:acetyl-CoA decarbonylase/synthase complex subunit beta|uniref:Acetyl-CoA decarbonylase/synthase complex subunit beta n=1 Tax=Methanothermobacter thermautotrophicus TaxID=145262 RepID=A0A7J4MWE4_METTF|nr:CO dehydrogenase/CO-methylating acetyl-CoA synthase complex subunit beta [Methanothermobacter sp. CaT2]MDK2874845.1 acetyl-CoA decarbonylase/synthase, complex subunit beta [Methanothermobacter sp.]BAM70811.1 acetyl-CoA decarbonylase/synthase complex beta subunit [Methanothermobacter sp. CaT2]HIH64915.1 CO dehydrogenase/CO-methylating acetyl-CoA synthase complex subunit beta [Methanothermobacter thermautotrophicus]HIH70773.1 CO dehydrogenase/CO-methylating acetyl-CoA synthase complex subunit 